MSPYQFLSRSKLSQHIKPPVRPVVQPSAQIEGENGLGWAGPHHFWIFYLNIFLRSISTYIFISYISDIFFSI